jgi:1-acyl-sn-glycerol-3-phosphate acyltransferase
MTAGSTAPVIGDVSRGVVTGASRHLVRSILLGIGRVSIRLRVEGLEHIPESGPLLVAANHVHNLDPLLLGAAFPRTLYFMAKKELFEVPVVGPLIAKFGGFPVDRGAADRSAIRRAEAVLAQGQALAMFPEGTRSPSGILQDGQPGAGLILVRSGAPLLPVAIVGTAGLPGNGSRTAAGHRNEREVIVRFGRPIELAPEPGERISSRDATARIMKEIAALLPDAYQPAER